MTVRDDAMAREDVAVQTELRKLDEILARIDADPPMPPIPWWRFLAAALIVGAILGVTGARLQGWI